jgi:hypothetical protein
MSSGLMPVRKLVFSGFSLKLVRLERYLITVKYFAMNAIVIENNPPIRNLIPMILKPSPSPGDTTLVQIQTQIPPIDTTITPAAKSGLNKGV